MMLKCDSLKVCAWKSFDVQDCSTTIYRKFWTAISQANMQSYIQKKIIIIIINRQTDRQTDRNSDIISRTLKRKGGKCLITKKQLYSIHKRGKQTTCKLWFKFYSWKICSVGPKGMFRKGWMHWVLMVQRTYSDKILAFPCGELKLQRSFEISWNFPFVGMD